MILFGLYTGARLSDVASLTWENIDLSASEMRFVARKTDKTIILPLDGPLAAHIEALPAADSPRTPLHPPALQSLRSREKPAISRTSSPICWPRPAYEKSNRTAKSMTRKIGAAAGMRTSHSIACGILLSLF